MSIDITGRGMARPYTHEDEEHGMNEFKRPLREGVDGWKTSPLTATRAGEVRPDDWLLRFDLGNNWITSLGTVWGDDKPARAKQWAADVCHRYNTQPALLAACEAALEALYDVPTVGDVYDEQHANTHTRATVTLRAAIAKATD